jgi:FkbM family methyltransferase
MAQSTLKPARRLPLPLLIELLGEDAPRLRLIDIGASPLDGQKPVYADLLQLGLLDLIGFEPDPKGLDALNAKKKPNEVFLPYAIGDGRRHTLRVCHAPGLSSILKPSHTVMDLFHFMSDLAQVKARHEVDTMCLDDIPETAGADFIKLDIQGAELMALQGATQRLRDVVALQIETNFIPMYENQPLFAEIDQFMRGQGFMLHKLFDQQSRMLRPFAVGSNPHVIGSQLGWADAVYVRDLTRLDLLTDRQLLALAIIAYNFYASFDLVLLPLGEHDRRHGHKLQANYLLKLHPYYDEQVRMTWFKVSDEPAESA